MNFYNARLKSKSKSYSSPVTSLIVAVVLGLLFAIAITGCGETKKLNFSYAELANPTSIDPSLVDESVGINISNYMFDGLVRYDLETGEVIPAVAERWEISEGGKVITFYLKKGVKFTNGREVKAGDFTYGWTRALQPETRSNTAMSMLGAIKGASDLTDGKVNNLEGAVATDDYTLKVTLDFPMAEFVSYLEHPVASPLPREEVERSDQKFSESPVGNGPYKLKEWRQNEYLVLEKNNDYYGTKGKLDEVTMKVIPSETTAITELKSGNIDAVKTLPPDQVNDLRNDNSVKIFEGEVAVLGFVGFYLKQDPWKGNLKLRQALEYGIDRKTIADKVLVGTAAAADGLVPANVYGHQSGAMSYKYDPDLAKKLLDEAGFPEGRGLPPITLTYRTEGPGGKMAQAIQSQFKDVGVKVEIEGLQSGVFLEQMLAGDLSLFNISWQADILSVDTFIYPLFKSDEPQNVFAYANPDVDELLDKARSEPNLSDRIKIYNEAERKILDDAPVIPVVFYKDVMAYSPRVTKFVHTPLGELALNEITVSDK